MGEKLTIGQVLTLLDLGEMGLPWLPDGRSSHVICRNLERKGLARYSAGYPVGFSITPAGRAALSREEGR